MAVHFDEFELDEGRRQVLRGGEPLHLPPKAFLLLQILIEQRPNAVSKRELYDRLWPSTFVSDTNLPTIVAELRTALGDDAHARRFIRTVHGFGYAFCGDVDGPMPADDSEPAVASLAGPRHHLRLVEGENVIGRDPSLRCAVDDPSVSRRHAVIVAAPGSFTVRDLGSKNGTLVGGIRLAGDPRDLRDGDDITFGSLQLTFHVSSPTASTITVGPGR